MARPVLARAAGEPDRVAAEGDVDEAGVAEDAITAEAAGADGADDAGGADEADTECGGAVTGGEADTLRASADS